MTRNAIRIDRTTTDGRAERPAAACTAVFIRG
jgi:hypothetical protein